MKALTLVFISMCVFAIGNRYYGLLLVTSQQGTEPREELRGVAI